MRQCIKLNDVVAILQVKHSIFAAIRVTTGFYNAFRTLIVVYVLQGLPKDIGLARSNVNFSDMYRHKVSILARVGDLKVNETELEGGP